MLNQPLFDFFWGKLLKVRIIVNGRRRVAGGGGESGCLGKTFPEVASVRTHAASGLMKTERPRPMPIHVAGSTDVSPCQMNVVFILPNITGRVAAMTASEHRACWVETKSLNRALVLTGTSAPRWAWRWMFG